MKKYIPQEMEKKWQDKWAKEGLYSSDLSKGKKHYVLAEFTYPSGDLHIGHWFTFCGADIYARLKRMQGYNVFFPNGFDAFGLPAENAAIKRGVHPKDWTMDNIARMKAQFASMGASFSFDHEVVTCLPQFYKWNQWIFLKMMEKGLAYKGQYVSNWCNNCQTVLANEGVEAGKCWRCGTQVMQKEVSQWFFKITDYAGRLLWPEAKGSEHSRRVSWPKSVMDAQNDWIGRSVGTVIKFSIFNFQFSIEVFTTRPDTVFGATFLVLAPEHPLVTMLLKSKVKSPRPRSAKPRQRRAKRGGQKSKVEEVKKYVGQAKKKTELERKENRQKTGVDTGLLAINPFNRQQMPVWVADYVLPGYGTGAIMAVPAHDQRDFEFAKKYALLIKQVIQPTGPASSQPHPTSSLVTTSLRAVDGAPRSLSPTLEEAYEGEGVLVNSEAFTGLASELARSKITDYIKRQNIGSAQVQYHLRDWSVSRQRYWGTPVPIIYCHKCWEVKSVEGIDYMVEDGKELAIVPVPEDELPVELPYDVDYQPKGKPPLATNKEWSQVKCPKCKGDAQRDPETLDTFVDSAWYFFRYLSPKHDMAPFDTEVAKRIMPVDIYFGGSEHTLGHTLYSRFLTRFFYDLGMVDFEEYALRRVNHGIVLGPDGQKMSKSRGNVVSPDEQVGKYGADVVRLFLAFFMPYDATGQWDYQAIWGPYRFLERVWGLSEKVRSDKGGREKGEEDLRWMHRTISKVTEDIENIKFNTAVAALMGWLNYLGKKGQVSKKEYKTLLLLLAPFAPHITEELWSMLGGKFSIHNQPWPDFDKKYLEKDQISIVVTIDGKVRDELLIQKDVVNDEKAVQEKALKSRKVQKFLIAKAGIKKVVYVPGKIINIVTGLKI